MDGSDYSPSDTIRCQQNSVNKIAGTRRITAFTLARMLCFHACAGSPAAIRADGGLPVAWNYQGAFKNTEAVGMPHSFSVTGRWADDGANGTCHQKPGYRALWASSALRAAANASLSTGGMHLMLAGLPHSFTVGVSLAWAFRQQCSIKEAFLMAWMILVKCFEMHD